MTRWQEIIEEVRALPRHERELVVEILTGDVDDDDFELSPEWKAEIKRRIENWEAGTAESLSWEEVRSRLRARINAAKR